MRARHVAGASLAVAGAAALAYSRLHRESRRVVRAERAVTVDRPADELYAFWRSFANAPSFMERVRAVEERGGGRSRWVGEAPGGTPADWHAQLTDERPGELLAWRADPPGASGSVAFAPAPGGRGTYVRLTLEAPGVAAAVLERHVSEDLRRFKRLVETGEVPTVEGQPAGARSPLGKLTAGRRERTAG